MTLVHEQLPAEGGLEGRWTGGGAAAGVGVGWRSSSPSSTKK